MDRFQLYSGDDINRHWDTAVVRLRLAAFACAAGFHGYAAIYRADGLWQLKHWARALERLGQRTHRRFLWSS
jgi:hypothetical protein